VSGNSAGAGPLTNTLSNVVGDVNPTTTNSVAATNSTSAAPPTTRPAVAENQGTDQPAPRIGQVTITLKKP
jgi:hypothetical protein